MDSNLFKVCHVSNAPFFFDITQLFIKFIDEKINYELFCV